MEQKENIVIGFGRFQPPTAGHHDMGETIKSLAELGDANHAIFTFQSQGDAKNPLPPDVKLKHMKTVLNSKNVFQHPDIRVPGDVFQLLHNQGYKRILLVAGGNRADEYEKFKKYFGKKTVSAKTGKVLDLRNIRPEDFNIHKIERDADSDTGGVEIHPHMIDKQSGKLLLPYVSGSRVRASVNDSIHNFMRSYPPHVTIGQARELQDDLKKHMKQFGLQEEVSALTRMKLAKAARRTASRRKIIRKSRQNRRRSLGQLKVRAKNEIISALRSKIVGKRRNWKKVPYAQRVVVDRNINKRRKLVTSMIKRIMPDVIKGETERLKNIHSSYNPILGNFMSNFLTEASRKSRTSKESNRQPVDSAQKAKRKRQNTNNQRNSRSNHKEKVKSGNVQGSVYVVKNTRGEIEIVDKKSLKKSHQVIVDAKDASLAKVKSYLNDKGFVNTKTSIALFGYVKDSGGEKEPKAEKSKGTSEKKPKEGKKAKASSGKQQEPEPQVPTVPATKKATKKDTFATSHDATAMEAGIAYQVNLAMGMTPAQMVEKGLIDKDTLKAVELNPHQSFMSSCVRAAQVLMKQFPGAVIRHTGKAKKEVKLTQLAKDNEMVDTTPKSDLVAIDPKTGEVIAGLSQKIGKDTQLGSGSPAEVITNIKWSREQLGNKLSRKEIKTLEDMVDVLENHLKGNPRTRQGPTSLYLPGGGYAGKDKEVNRREDLHRKLTKSFNDLMNSNEDLRAYFVYASLTGTAKFEPGLGIASHIFSANRDGTDAKTTPITLDYARRISDGGKIKFQATFKSSAIETTDVKKKWEEFQKAKKAAGEKVSLKEDFRAYSYRSVLRVFLSEETNRLSGRNLMKVLIEAKSKFNDVIPPEPRTEEEAVQYLEDAIKYIGDDAVKMNQFFEDAFDVMVAPSMIDYTEYADNSSAFTNTIMINGKEFQIPVEEPYDYAEDGTLRSPIGEERDYKSEYKNYHSKPEQRANRSKRVLARRLMMKLGKVRKGDGKDVDHKDGDPQNNGKHNLRVRNKSENRADND